MSYSRTYPDAKDPDDVLDYEWDFAADLAEGEAIASHDVAITGATLDSDSTTGTRVIAWVSGGAAGTDALIAFTIITDNATPRTIERTARLRIRER